MLQRVWDFVLLREEDHQSRVGRTLTEIRTWSNCPRGLRRPICYTRYLR